MNRIESNTVVDDLLQLKVITVYSILVFYYWTISTVVSFSFTLEHFKGRRPIINGCV